MLPIIQHWDDDVIQIQIPLPSSLKWVNSYLIRGDDGYTLIDPGMHTTEAEESWIYALTELNIVFRDIKQIVLTHYHPDHYGLAGWFQLKSDAPVYLTESGVQMVRRMWTTRGAMTKIYCDWYLKNGMDMNTLNKIVPHMERSARVVTPHPQVNILPEQGHILLGNRFCKILSTPGHAQGHVSFYDEAHEHIFCGDQVLPQISPNVSLIPGGEADPLRLFLNSLSELAGLSVERAYPGHRDPFSNFCERAREILDHHQERLSLILDYLKNPMSAFELCVVLFADKLSLQNIRFAVGETLAHLKYLEQDKRVNVEENANGIATYFIGS